MLVLVETVVLVLVLVLGVVVVVVVVGVSVDVVVLGLSVVLLGEALSVPVAVPSVAAGACESALPAVDVLDGADVLEVVDPGPDESLPPVKVTTAYTIKATRMTATAPMLTRPAGLRYHGVGGSGGGAWG